MSDLMDSVDYVFPAKYCTGCFHPLGIIPGPSIWLYCPDKECVRFGLVTIAYDERPGYSAGALAKIK